VTTNNPKPGEPAGTPNDRAKAAVETWLNSHGSRLEYRTYMAFRKYVPFGTAGLGQYVHSDSEDPREIDAYTYCTASADDLNSAVSLRVLCECKYSKDKPWVLLYGNRNRSSWITDWFHTPRSAALKLHPKFSQQETMELTKTFHFTQGQWLAHTITQTHLDPDNLASQGQKQNGKCKHPDYAYDALRKITYAAWDFVKGGEALCDRMYEMVFPCLVVDGPLFDATFDPKTEQFHATRIKYGRVCWQGCHNGTNVDVVCAEFLEEYAKMVEDCFMTLVPLFVDKFKIPITLPDLDSIPRKAARGGRETQGKQP
jgi:hypothetical protein